MGKRRKRKRIVPPIVRLRYAPVDRDVYCELCGEPIRIGDRLAWWPLRRWHGRARIERPTAYCVRNGCHSACVRAKGAIEGTGRRTPTEVRRAAAELEDGFLAALDKEET